MNLIKLSKKMPHERFSFGWKFAETSRINFGKSEELELKKTLDELRKAGFADAGVYIDISKTLRLSEGSVKKIMFIVNNVAKNNVIGADIYTATNPTDEIKVLISQINAVITTTKTTAVTVKKCREKEVVEKWQLIFIVLGFLAAAGGTYLGVKEIDAKGFKFESNMTQILGAISFGLGALPILAKYRHKIWAGKPAATTQDDQ